MTWVVYVLLALNLALLTWNLQTGTDDVATPALAAPAPGEAEQLPLLTELSADALRPRITALAGTAGGREFGSSAQAGAGEQGAVAQASSDAAPSGGAAKDSNNESGGQNGGRNNGQSSSTSSDVAGVADTNQDKPQDLETAGPMPPPGTPVGSVTTATACMTLGPLSADAPVQEMSAWLTQAGAAVDVRTDERREVALYWVFFPPRTTRELAVAEVEKLRSEGVTDVIAVPKGDMANAVSLGVFSRTDSRDRRVREMNQRGYQPSVAPRYRVKRASWIDVSMVANALTTQSIKARWPDVEVSPKPCPVAAAGLNPAIAVGQGASYNTTPPAPRRFFFSGSDSSPALQDSRSSR